MSDMNGQIESGKPTLDSLFAEIETDGPTTQTERRAAGGDVVEKLRYSHEAMIDLIITDPWISQGKIAKTFGYTESWVCLVMQSDAFQSKLAERKNDLVDPIIRATIEERFRAMLTKSLEILQEKLSRPTDKISDSTVLKAIELGAKAMGIGGNAPPPPPAVDRLEKLAERLLILQPANNLKLVEGVTIEQEVDIGGQQETS